MYEFPLVSLICRVMFVTKMALATQRPTAMIDKAEKIKGFFQNEMAKYVFCLMDSFFFILPIVAKSAKFQKFEQYSLHPSFFINAKELMV